MFPNERRLAEAWGKGGSEGEKQKRESNSIENFRNKIGGNGVKAIRKIESKGNSAKEFRK